VGTDSVWLIFSARVIVDSAARVSRSVSPSLSLLLLCRDNGGLGSADRTRARVRTLAAASADCGMGVSATRRETRGSTSMQRRVIVQGRYATLMVCRCERLNPCCSYISK
jgi:hypothetical protein